MALSILRLLLLLRIAMLLRMVRLVASSGRAMVRRHDGRATLQVDIYPTRILLSGILQSKFLTDLLDAGLDLLDMVHGVISLSHDTVHQIPLH